MEPFTTLTSCCVVLPAENVDTDQIIPARFLKTIDRRGLGAHLFADWRLDEQGRARPEFPLNADIFRNNALKNGLLPVTLLQPAHARLLELLAASPLAPVAIDLDAQAVTLQDGTAHAFPVDPFSRHCLLNGVDELGFLLGEENAIAAYESAHPARVCTR